MSKSNCEHERFKIARVMGVSESVCLRKKFHVEMYSRKNEINWI